MKVIITDVKIVGLCLKHRGNEPAPRNKYGELWNEKDIACISCAIVGYDGADETVAGECSSNTNTAPTCLMQRRQEHDTNVIINRLKDVVRNTIVKDYTIRQVEEIIDEFEVKE